MTLAPPSVPSDSLPVATAGHTPSDKLRPFASVFLIALAVAPGAVVLHELGHYGSQFPLGYTDVPFISYASSAMGTAPVDVPFWLADGLTSAAGTVVSLLLVLAGVAVARHGGPAPLALALVAFDCVRVLATLLITGVLDGDSPASGLSDGFSELAVLPYHLGAMWAAVAVSLVDLAVPLVAAVVVYRALRARGARTVGAQLALSSVGAVTGLALWMGVFGPAVLP